MEEVNEVLLNDLVSMGFAEDVSREALLAVSNSSVSDAIEWLNEHQTQVDKEGTVDEVPNNEVSAATERAKPHLTPEEAALKALELQKRLREERKAREKEEAILREKNRIQSTKMLQDQQRKLEEATKERELEALRREKEEKKVELQRQRELLKKDWIERFGTAEGLPPAQEEIQRQTPKARVLQHLTNLRKMASSEPDKRESILICLNMLSIYLKNVKEKVTEPQYRQIRKENNAFKNRVSQYDDAISILNICGFEDSDDHQLLVLRTQVPDLFLFGEVLKYVEIIKKQIS